MNVLAILAHDKKKSLNHFLFEHVTTTLKSQGHTIQIIDLYEHHKEIPFYLQDQNGNSTTNTSFDNYPFVETCKKHFLAADAIVLVFPTYCFSVPAILKAWIDMLTKFAYEKKAGSFPKPLHHIKSVVAITSMGMPWIAKVFWAGNCIKKYIKKVFSFIGIKNIQVYEITSVETINQSNIQKHLDHIKKTLTQIND